MYNQKILSSILTKRMGALAGYLKDLIKLLTKLVLI